jgi:hypothetical protein
MSKLCVDKLCVDKLCVSKLRGDKLCVDKLCVSKLCVAGGGQREEEAGGSAGPKTRTPHKDVGKKTLSK